MARRLVEHGAVHIDADELARRVVEPGTPALAQIVETFGDDAARAKLNAIVHPAVRELSSKLFAKAERENPDAVVVYDVPLLVEASVDHPFDLIVVTNAPRRTQVKRLVEERGYDPLQAEARVDAQVDNTRRLEIADVVIDTDGSLGHTVSQADALWLRIAEERARK